MKFKVERVDKVCYFPPAQGASEFVRVHYRFRVWCPACAGDGFTWSTTWNGAWRTMETHVKRHRETQGLINELAMMPDEVEALQFRG